MSARGHFAPVAGPGWLRPFGFLYRMATWRPKLVLAATLTVALLGVFEGLALTLLIPLLGLLGLDAGAAPAGPVKVVVAAFARAGVPVTVTSVLALFAAAALAQTLLQALQQYFVVTAGERLTYRLRNLLFAEANRASWPFLLATRSGHLQSLVVTEAQRLGVIFGNSISAAGLVVLFVIYAALAAWLSWEFTLLVLAVLTVSTLVLRRLYAGSRRFGAFSSAASARMQEVLSEHLRSAKLVRIANAEKWSGSVFDQSAEAAGEYGRRHQVNTILVRASMEPIALVLLVVILYLSFTRSTAPAAQTLVFVAIFYRLVPRIVQLQQLVQRIVATLPSYEMIGGMLAQLEANRAPEGGRPYGGLKSAIEVTGLVVEGDGQRIIDASSFRIPAGTTTAVSGPSGAGKSTLIDVLVGLRPSTSGDLRYDGVPIAELDLASLRRRIGYVPQDLQFFHDSIAANLRMGRAGTTEAQLWAALERAQAAGFVRELPDGMETVMGAQGLRLSGGQRQRLALARALIGDPDLLILDEPTSALDAETEQLLAADLQRLKGKITIIVVAHRDTLLQGADLLLRFEGGRIVSGR